MLKSILSVLDHTVLSSSKHFFNFTINLEEYFIYRDNSYKLFNVSKWKHVEPNSLITDYFLEESAFRDQIAKIEYKGNILESLIDVPFKKSLGQFLQRKNLNNTNNVETVSQSDIHFFLHLEYLSDRIFVSKYGLSLFSEKNNGIIFFNEYNVQSLGVSNLLIPRITTNDHVLDLNDEEILILFSPYTLKDCFSTGKSHFKDTILFLTDLTNDTRSISKYFYPKFSIHLRPTKQELLNFLVFITTYLYTNKKHCKFLEENETIFFTTTTANYTSLRNTWIEKLNTEKDLFIDSPENKDVAFRVKCIEKKAKYDIVEFSFKNTATNLFVFIKSFLLNYFSDDNLNIKAFVYIYYDKDLPNAIDLSILPTKESMEIPTDQLIEEEDAVDESYVS